MDQQLRQTIQSKRDQMKEENVKLQKQLTHIKNANQNLNNLIIEEDSTITIESVKEPPKMKRIGGGYLPP